MVKKARLLRGEMSGGEEKDRGILKSFSRRWR
jgi:hypothetical protein